MLILKRTVDGLTVWSLRPTPQPKPTGPTIKEVFDAVEGFTIQPGAPRLTPFRPRQRRKRSLRFGPAITRRQLDAILALRDMRARP